MDQGCSALERQKTIKTESRKADSNRSLLVLSDILQTAPLPATCQLWTSLGCKSCFLLPSDYCSLLPCSDPRPQPLMESHSRLCQSAPLSTQREPCEVRITSDCPPSALATQTFLLLLTLSWVHPRPFHWLSLLSELSSRYLLG